MRGKIGTPTIMFKLFPKEITKNIETRKLPREVKARLKFIEYYFKCKNASKTIRHFGIAKSTFYKWLNRFKKYGIDGLYNLPKTPKKKRKPTIRNKYRKEIIETRKKFPNWSSKKIAKYLNEEKNIKVSPSTIYRVLKEEKLIEKSKRMKNKKKKTKQINKKRIKRGLKANNKGDVVQIDTKHITQAGKTYYQFTAVDKFSRMMFSLVYPTKSSRNAKKFFMELEKYFEFEIKKVQTDNGSEFLGEFHKYLESKGIEHYFSYPKSPKTNAIVERTIRTIEEELWTYEGTNYEIDELNKKLRRYTRIYNFIRPHEGINYKRPADLAYR